MASLFWLDPRSNDSHRIREIFLPNQPEKNEPNARLDRCDDQSDPPR